MGQMEKTNRRQGWMSQREGTADKRHAERQEQILDTRKYVCYIESNADENSSGYQGPPGAMNTHQESQTGHCKVLGGNWRWQMQSTDHLFLGGGGPGVGEEDSGLTWATGQG